MSIADLVRPALLVAALVTAALALAAPPHHAVVVAWQERKIVEQPPRCQWCIAERAVVTTPRALYVAW